MDEKNGCVQFPHGPLCHFVVPYHSAAAGNLSAIRQLQCWHSIKGSAREE